MISVVESHPFYLHQGVPEFGLRMGVALPPRDRDALRIGPYGIFAPAQFLVQFPEMVPRPHVLGILGNEALEKTKRLLYVSTLEVFLRQREPDKCIVRIFFMERLQRL